MRGAACSILGLYDGEGRKLEGPLLIAPDEAAQLAARRCLPLRSAAAPRISCRSRSAARSPGRGDAAELAAERRCARRDRLESGETSPDLAAALSPPARREAASSHGGGEALMGVVESPSIFAPRRSTSSRWRRSTRAASRAPGTRASMAQFLASPDDALPDRVGSPTARANRRKASSSRGRPATRPRCSRFGVDARSAGARGLGRARCFAPRSPALRAAGREAAVSRGRGRQTRRRSAFIDRSVPSPWASGTRYYEHGADAAIFSLAL